MDSSPSLELDLASLSLSPQSSPSYLEVITIVSATKWIQQLKRCKKGLQELEEIGRCGAKALEETPEERQVRTILVTELQGVTSLSSHVTNLLHELFHDLADQVTELIILSRDMSGISFECEITTVSDNSDYNSWPFPMKKQEFEDISPINILVVAQRLRAIVEHTIRVLILQRDLVNFMGHASRSDALPQVEVQLRSLKEWGRLTTVGNKLIKNYKEPNQTVVKMVQRISFLSCKMEEWISEAVIDLILVWKRGQ